MTVSSVATGYDGISLLAGNAAYNPPGNYESIATVIVGSGGASEINFTSIPGTYASLQVRYIARHSTTDDTIGFQFNADTGSNYARHRLSGDGSSASSAAVTSGTRGTAGTANNTANTFMVSIMDILDYTDTNKYKTVRILPGRDYNGSGDIQLLSTLWMNTNAITSIKFYFESAGNFAQYSKFALYGIKD